MLNKSPPAIYCFSHILVRLHRIFKILVPNPYNHPLSYTVIDRFVSLDTNLQAQVLLVLLENIIQSKRWDRPVMPQEKIVNCLGRTDRIRSGPVSRLYVQFVKHLKMPIFWPKGHYASLNKTEFKQVMCTSHLKSPAWSFGILLGSNLVNLIFSYTIGNYPHFYSYRYSGKGELYRCST